MNNTAYKTFKLHSDQKEIVEAALDNIKKHTGTGVSIEKSDAEAIPPREEIEMVLWSSDWTRNNACFRTRRGLGSFLCWPKPSIRKEKRKSMASGIIPLRR